MASGGITPTRALRFADLESPLATLHRNGLFKGAYLGVLTVGYNPAGARLSGLDAPSWSMWWRRRPDPRLRIVG
jgi:hypothetical protein